jgi:hypothetical protein
MTERDPHEDLERALFDAARQELPEERVRARAKQLVRSASAGIHAVSTRRKREVWYLPALGFGLAIAVIAFAVVSARQEPPRDATLTITQEALEPVQRKRASSPMHEVPVVEPAAPARPALAPRATDTARKLVPAAPKPPPTLAEEIAILDRARSALATKDGAQALALVDEYERKLGGTRMRAEAALLRIEALVERGERARAAELARRFVKDHAGSPLADRARVLSAIDEQPEGER